MEDLRSSSLIDSMGNLGYMKIIAWLLLALFFGPHVFAEYPVKIETGTVFQVDKENHQLNVEVKEEAKSSSRILKLQADVNTRFVMVRSFSELKVGDSVSVDYIQNRSGALILKRLERLRPR